MNEKCLKIIGTEKLFNYDDAKKACQREPFGRLFTITSPKEQGFMVNFLFKKNKTDHNLWIGLRKENNTFKWSDSTHFDYQNWAIGAQPG